MKNALGKSILISLVCCAAFGAAYVSVNRVFGQTCSVLQDSSHLDPRNRCYTCGVHG